MIPHVSGEERREKLEGLKDLYANKVKRSGRTPLTKMKVYRDVYLHVHISSTRNAVGGSWLPPGVGWSTRVALRVV